jgi:hypothetical protein
MAKGPNAAVRPAAIAGHNSSVSDHLVKRNVPRKDEIRKYYNLDEKHDAEVIYFDRWSPDPLVVDIIGGGTAYSIHTIRLSILRAVALATGNVQLIVNFGFSIKSEGWTTFHTVDSWVSNTHPSAVVQLLASSGGFLDAVPATVEIKCPTPIAPESSGGNGMFFLKNDIFSAISSARLIVSGCLVWPCK